MFILTLTQLTATVIGCRPSWWDGLCFCVFLFVCCFFGGRGVMWRFGGRGVMWRFGGRAVIVDVWWEGCDCGGLVVWV